MASNSDGYTTLIALIILILLLSVFIPAVFIALETPTDLVVTQTEDSRITLNPGLDANLDLVEDGNKDNISVTLIDTKTKNSVTETSIAEGDTATTTLSGETIEISHLEKLSNTEATIQYHYPLYFGWPDGTKFIVRNITSILLVVVVLFAFSAGIIAWNFGGDF